MALLIQQYLWLVPIILSGLIWAVVVMIPYKEPEQEGGFECGPLFEVTTRVTIATVISLLVWLAFVAVALWMAKHG